MSVPTITVPWRRGYNYGVGADLASGSPMNLAVEGAVEGVSFAGGATVDFAVRRIETTEQLHQALGIDADASYGSGLFGAGLSNRFAFANQCAVQTTSLFLLLSCTVRLEYLSITRPGLTDAASELQDNPQLFAERYGNMFVRGIDRGGLFVGVFRLDTHSETDQREISDQLEGSYGLFSASVAARFEQVRRRYRADAYVRMLHEGGPVDLQITDPTQPSQLLDNANRWLSAFQANPAANSTPYLVSLAPVTIAEGPPPPNAIDLEHAQDVIKFCARQRNQILDQMNLLNFVLSRQDDYEWTGDPTPTPAGLRAALEGLQKDFDLIADCASVAVNHPTQAAMPATYAEEQGRPYPLGQMPAMPRPKARPALPRIDITMTLDGVLLAGGWRDAPALAQMSEDDKRNTVITELSARTFVPEPFFLQQFNNYQIIGKAAVYIFILKAGIRGLDFIRSMTTDDLRNTLIVENDARTHQGAALQGMDDQRNVYIALDWYRRETGL